MDILTLTSLVVGGLSLFLSALAQMAKTSEKTLPYAEFLERIERVLSGKPTKVGSLEERLEKALGQLTNASNNVNDLLGEVQNDIKIKRKESDRLREIIDDLKKEYETNKSLANLTKEQSEAFRQIFTKEVEVLKRRSYLPDILINFGVGAFFFILGIVVTRYAIQ